MQTIRRYPHAPVALTVLELKHPQSDFLSRGDLAGIKQKLERVAPLQKAEDVTQVQMLVNPGSGPMSNSRNLTVHRYLSRDKRTSITYSSESVVIETTDYVNWTWFCDLIEIAVAARQEIAPVDGVERVGLRYIDEIRVGNAKPKIDWREWVAEALVAPEFESVNPPLIPLQQQAVVQYAVGQEEDTLTLRYGAVNGPPAFNTGPNLVRADVPEPGPYFLLDTDSAWTLGLGSAVPELDVNYVLNIARRLHGPAEALFEALITPRARKELFGGV